MDYIEGLKKEKATLEARISQLEKYLNELSDKIPVLQTDIQTLQKIEKHKSDQIAIFLKEERGKVEAQAIELKSKIREYDILIAQAKKTEAVVNAKCKAADECLATAKANVAERIQKVGAAEAEVQRLRQSLDREIINCKKRDEILSQKIYEADRRKRDFTHKYRDLQADEHTLLGLIDEQERLIEKANAKQAVLDAREPELNRREQEITERENKFKAEIDLQRAQVETYHKEVKALEDDVLDQKAEALLLKTTNQKLSETLKRQFADLNNREARVIDRETALKRQMKGIKK